MGTTTAETYFTFLTEDKEYEVEIEIEYYFEGGSAGRYYGPPEDCYPDENPEVDFNESDISLVVNKETTKEEIEAFKEYKLTDDDLDRIEAQIWEQMESEEDY